MKFTTLFLYPINFININGILPIKSFLINNIEWLFYKRKKESQNELNQVLNSVYRIEQVKKTMKMFKWTKENVDVIENKKIIAKKLLENDPTKFEDDCDFAANLSRILFEKIGIKSNLYYLGKVGSGHIINVSEPIKLNNDKEIRYIASNENVKSINNDEWKRKIKEGRYNFVKDYEYSFKYRPWISIIVGLVILGFLVLIGINVPEIIEFMKENQ